ncbi:MAG TPA: polymer-forming cytoskeletal protein [Sphingomicrobium sp.]|nr:polymer-forming cytoskeletal protein [Sphingomicrobium sp.]
MFSKKPDSTARPSGNSAMAGSTFSVLGPDIAIDGDLTAKVDLHLDGRINGDIRCAALIQGEASEVAGMVVAESARVAGRIKGSISADVLVILKTARIEGDVAYGTLTIEEGAQVTGKFTPRSAEVEPKLTLAGGTEAI